MQLGRDCENRHGAMSCSDEGQGTRSSRRERGTQDSRIPLGWGRRSVLSLKGYDCGYSCVDVRGLSPAISMDRK